MATANANLEPDTTLSSKSTIAVATVLFVAACLLPATDIGCGFGPSDNPSNEAPTLGLIHLLGGWLFYPSSLAPWSANFIFFAGLVQLLAGRARSAAVLGIMATVLGLTTLTCFKNEGKYIGYYLWQTSQAVLALGSLHIWQRGRQVTGQTS